MEHALGATVNSGILDDAKGLRTPGLHVPGQCSSTFTQHGERSFWNITRPERPIVIQLEGERCNRLVRGVEDLHELADLINAAINGQ